MTIRKKLTLIVSTIIIVSIFITSTISSIFINSYFKGFLSEDYENTIEIISDYAEEIILEGSSGKHLRSYLVEPIVSVRVTNLEGEELYYGENEFMPGNHNNRKNFFKGDVDIFEVREDGELIGRVEVERFAEIQNSETVWLFNFALFRGVGFAAMVALVLSLLLSRKLSKSITSDLKDTSDFANSIDTKDEYLNSISNTKEIKSIQMQLKNLSRKLKIQNRIRKGRVDYISHEVKTPITILKSQLEGSLDGILEMDEKRLRSSLEAVNKLQHLTSDMSKIFEAKDETLLVSRTDFDLVAELKMIQSGLQLQFQSKGIDLVIKSPSKLVINSDKNLLSICLYNLLVNALKFTNEGSVTVTVTANPTMIAIADTGIGISHEHIDSIFDPYFRSYPSEQVAGDGLGLFITKRNIEALDAKISVTSSLGHGTTFKIKL